jgi:hypothetical protein
MSGALSAEFGGEVLVKQRDVLLYYIELLPLPPFGYLPP